MNFFYYESIFIHIYNKKKKIFFFFWGGGSSGGARVSVFFFTKNPNLKKIFFCFVCVCVGGVDGWTVKQAQTHLSLQVLRSWGHNNALMFKLCP